METTKERKNRFSIVGVFAAFFSALFILVTSAPLLEHFGADWLSQPIYTVSGFLCHQMYTRSFHLFDLQVAVCARDQFMYLSMALAAFVTLKYNVKRLDWWIALLLVLPAAFDGGLQLFSSIGLLPGISYQSTNLLRAVTGTLLGCGMGYFLFPTLRETENELA